MNKNVPTWIASGFAGSKAGEMATATIDGKLMIYILQKDGSVSVREA